MIKWFLSFKKDYENLFQKSIYSDNEKYYFENFKINLGLIPIDIFYNPVKYLSTMQ